MADVTGDLVAEAQFDSKIAAWARGLSPVDTCASL